MVYDCQFTNALQFFFVRFITKMSTLFTFQNSPLTSFLPDHEGKAGMASLILKQNTSLDLGQMYKQVVTYLPSYACPLFLRVQVSCIIAQCIKHLHHLNTETAKWITENACWCISWLVLELVLFSVFINGVLGKALHKKSVNLQIMLKQEELYKWVEIGIIPKDLGRLEAWTWENKKIQISKLWTIASGENNLKSILFNRNEKTERSRAKAGDTNCAQ